MSELEILMDRWDPENPDDPGLSPTKIFVRAKDDKGKFFSVDIWYLKPESLTVWLKSRGGDNPWAENVVRILLGHE